LIKEEREIKRKKFKKNTAKTAPNDHDYVYARCTQSITTNRVVIKHCVILIKIIKVFKQLCIKHKPFGVYFPIPQNFVRLHGAVRLV